MDKDALEFIINHLFLPPKLPQKDDSLLSSQQQLLSHLSNCARLFCEGLRVDNVAAEVQDRWGTLRRTLANLASLHETPHISKESLHQIIGRMRLDDVLCLHITSQNAGVILRRREEDLTVEFFQASPNAAVVTGTTGKLIIHFPSMPRLSLPINDTFIQSLSALLADLDCIAMPDAIPKTRRAGSMHDEIREVPDIRYISELLGGIARALTPVESAEHIASSTVYTIKRIDDHVLWKSALAPWRRSPKWLIIRVALQTTLKQWGIEDKYGYKIFITFVLAKTLEFARAAGVSHDLLFAMSAKVSARLWKLRSVFDVKLDVQTRLHFPIKFISHQLSTVSLLLNEQWSNVQDREAAPSSWAAPSAAQILAAETLTLPRSSAHFAAVKARTFTLDAESAFFQQSEFEHRLHLQSEHNAGKPLTAHHGVCTPDLFFLLMQLEQRIAKWANTSSSPGLSGLADLIEKYDQLASSFSSISPGIFSRIFLAVLELWVLLDQSTTAQFPLLLDYSPELSISAFEPLLLPELSQMRRLHRVELYLMNRRASVRYPHLSIFAIHHHQASLPSRYFTQTQRLQELRNIIHRRASEEKNQKMQELRSKTEKYAELVGEKNQVEHEHVEEPRTDYRGRTTYVEITTNCHRCSIEKQISALDIISFEWPLPEDELLSRLVIFELSIPAPFGIWRDATYRLALSHAEITSPKKTPVPTPFLRKYTPLQHDFNPYNSNQRIDLASTVKSFLKSHYKKHSFPCTQSDVILNHPLKYEFWDSVAGEWLGPDFPVIDIRQSCTPQFPPGPYTSLAWTATSTNHTANDVIARQSRCPSELSYHEWAAFGHLRAGVRLQWQNIMLQIITGILDLADPAAYLLIQQAAWQVEAASGDQALGHYREAHFDISQEAFGMEMVDVLRKRLESIAENWQEGWTAATFAVVACRLFSLNESESVKTKALAFLSYLRHIIYNWVNEVLLLLNSQVHPLANTDLITRVLQLAASCRSTYAVGSEVFPGLFHDRAASSIFIHTGLILHIYIPPEIDRLPATLRYLLERDTIISTEALPILLDVISCNGNGLDDAVLGVWQGFCRDGRPWRNIEGQWMTCKTSASLDRRPRSVYTNLLDGSFLVDGQAQGTLPKEIRAHPVYKTFFPNQVTLDIVPSTMKGMQYQSRQNMDGFEVHFKLNQDELLIRTRNGSFVSEFVASKHLEGDIPTNLLVGMVHIFHEHNQCLEIYPAPMGWKPLTRALWRLNLSAEGMRTLSRIIAASNVAETVLDPTSSLVKSLSDIFRPLEASSTNLMVYSRSGRLHINLPRYNLQFSLDLSGRLESKELPGFYVAPSQSIGTLIGLQSKLVLNSVEGEMPKVFIPEGKISISCSHGDHPSVIISPSSTANHIKTFAYDVDTVICRVIGDGSLTSWYRLAYLHIITSSYLCDPLLHRTGLEQGQEMLGSAQSFAYMHLEAEHYVLLQQIMDLASTRNYYPKHLTSMETVDWHGFLTPIVQCGRFVPLVYAIINYARKQALFHPPEPQTIDVEYLGKLPLWKRAEYRVSTLVSNVPIDECDIPAGPARCLDCTESIAREQAVAETVTLVRQWPTSINITDDLWSHFKGWGSCSSIPIADTKIENPRAWLQDPPARAWFSMFHLSRALIKDRDHDGLMVALGILAYREDMDPALVRTLLAVATNASTIRVAAELIPMDTFNFAHGHTLDLREVVDLVSANCRSVETTSALLGVSRRAGEKTKAWRKRRNSAYDAQKQTQCNELAKHIFSHWPVVPDMTSLLPNSFMQQHYIVDIPDLRTEATDLFKSKSRNRKMFKAVDAFQWALNTVQIPLRNAQLTSPQSKPVFTGVASRNHVAVTLRSLLQRIDGCLARRHVSSDSSIQINSAVATTPEASSHSSASRRLISRLEQMAIDGPKSRYMTDLTGCVSAFEELNYHITRCVSAFKGRDSDEQDSNLEGLIRHALGPTTLFERMLDQTGQWPSSGPESLVRQLSREAWQVLPESWRVTLTRYAEGLSRKQQQQRIAVLSSRPVNEGEYAREVGTRSGQGWDPILYPDWLLVQLDADLLIRPNQVSIAEQMMGQQLEKNTLMQLNMGEGKSSVIVPIISATLANGQQLVRVIVLKPLSAQMFQLLKQRVCGLANRRLYYLPFSRDIQLDCDKIKQIVALFKECARVGGILLCQPEHLLSFQLMGLLAFCQNEYIEETRLLLTAQKWLDQTARDILDESDEILNVRYQLIYTIGTVSPPEGRPWRWNITQSVFSLLAKVVNTVPEGLEISAFSEAKRFPLTRILAPHGRQVLLESLVYEIVFKDELQEWISFRTCTSGEKVIVSRFLSQLDITSEDARSLQSSCNDERFSQLLLLRGLFAHGILRLALEGKRWRVDYGLDLKRSMLAVPYRAKDSPALRAEFGHPEMIIVLTCLSYYYGGLSNDQLNTAFKFLLSSDNPEAQYEHWVKGIDGLPANLANLHGLNLEDFEQKTDHIFPILRYNKVVIDFYMSECVFPKEAREFQYKLTTNAWDLARTKARLVTGFSGTNDNRYLLPLSIEQLDQDSQRHTNAQVLEYILQRENRGVLCTGSDDALGLLRRLVQQQPPVMVLLDVGAQVLELQNEGVAREWLKLDSRPEIEGAVYFDPTSDEICVLTRDGRVQPLASSLYKTQLRKTLVYLDEAHTRGTDFKFPAGSRAVVTLGPRLGKDKLVQGCMRMRRLGKDHSVLFFASNEIWVKIQTTTQAQDLDSSHVLLWTIQETCAQIKENGSLWANQGLNFDARHTALNGGRPYASVVAALQEQESRTLEELYGVKPQTGNEDQAQQLSQLQIEIKQRCGEFGIVLTHNALSEEQERELAHEKEEQRELERIPGAIALDHRDDDDLRDFIDTGVIRPRGTFISLKDCFANTSWISSLPQGALFRGQDLCATKDFRDTIHLPRTSSGGSMDSYLRPVQWVLSSSECRALIIVSPFEANKWVPAIRRSRFVSLHLYAPRISRNTFSFESLDSFAGPRRRRAPDRELIHELNLFAGQLFCDNKRSMKEVCGILGLHLQALNDREDLQGMVDSSGFVRDRRARTELGLDACDFETTPLPFFRELFASRRKNQGFALTHMGQILRGNDPKDDFEEDADSRANG